MPPAGGTWNGYAKRSERSDKAIMQADLNQAHVRPVSSVSEIGSDLIRFPVIA